MLYPCQVAEQQLPALCLEAVLQEGLAPALWRQAPDGFPAAQLTCIYLFHELPPETRRQVAREMARVVRPGGLVRSPSCNAQGAELDIGALSSMPARGERLERPRSHTGACGQQVAERLKLMLVAPC